MRRLRHLREALELSVLDARREEEARKRERDAELVARLKAADEARRAAAVIEARRVAAEVLQQRQNQLQQLDENRRMVAIEAFVERAAKALNEYQSIGKLRRTALTIGVAAASQLLEQTLLVEQAGGLLKNDGSGQRRTLGGVFLGVLLRENISKEAYKHINAKQASEEAAPTCAPAYVSGVPPSVSSGKLCLLLGAYFGPVEEYGKLKPRLRAAPDGLLCGKFYFRQPAHRAAAVAQGCVVVREAKFGAWPQPSPTAVAASGLEEVQTPSGHCRDGSWRLTIDDAPTYGVHVRNSQMKFDEPWCSNAVCAQLAAAGKIDEDEHDEEEWCPDDFICPITLERLVDPVTAADGLTYERNALQGWIDKHAADQVVLSPATGAPLAHRELVSNAEILEKLASVGRLASWLE